MPSIYAHFRFGEEAIPHFSPSQQELIQQERDSFDLGLLGPDIFFYSPKVITAYLKKEPSFGNKLHRMSFAEVVNQLMLPMPENPQGNKDREKLIEAVRAYYYGYLGHFLLDSHAHPTVNELAPIYADHLKLERYFDEALAYDAGLKIWEMRFQDKVKKSLAPMLELAYRNFPEAKTKTTLSSMRLVRKLMNGSTENRAKLARGFWKQVYNGFQELSYFPNPKDRRGEPSIQRLKQNFDHALSLYPKSLDWLEQVLNQGQIETLPNLFELNFSGELPKPSKKI